MMTEKVKILYKQLIVKVEVKNPLEFMWEKKWLRKRWGGDKKNDFAEKYAPLVTGCKLVADCEVWLNVI